MAKDSYYADVPAVAVGQAMPSHPDAESSVLAAMLLSDEVRSDCLIDLEEECFYIPSNRKIFRAIRELFDRDMPVDTITLADHLETKGDLDNIGGSEHLVDLGYNTMALASWRHHINILKRDLTLRKMIAASAQISALAYDAPQDTKEVVDKAEELIFSVTDERIATGYKPVGTIMQELYSQLGEMSDQQVESMGIQTGFAGLDERLLGLRGGQMVVVGARPAVGKTSFSLNLALNAAMSGASVAFFSLEMSSLEIGQKLLATRSGIDMTKIRTASIAPDEWQPILQATEELSQSDIMIDDTPGTTVTEIRAKARRMLHNKENGLVIIDYLQLVTSTNRSDNRANDVSEMSRGIKIMAKDLDIPVVALSQLSRAGKNRTDKTPQLSDLRESGAIEQDADIVILLDRSQTEEEAKREERPDLGITRFIIAKNRAGSCGIADFMFLGAKNKFVPIDYKHSE